MENHEFIQPLFLGVSKKTIFGSNRRKGTGNCKETPALYQNAECVMRNKWVTFKEQ